MIRLTESEWQKRFGHGETRSKYNSRKTVVDGIKFDSAKEANRYKELIILRRDGEITHFLMQVPFLLDGGVVYKLDFLIFWTYAPPTYEDVKGFKTQIYRLKKKMVEAKYPITIEEV